MTYGSNSVTGTGSTTTINSLTASSTYTFVVSNGSCTSIQSSDVRINSQPVTPAVTLGTISQITNSATSFEIPFTIVGGGPLTFSLSTASPALSGFTNITNENLPSISPIKITIPASTPNTYAFNISFKNATCTSTQESFSLTIINTSLLNSTIAVTGSSTYTYTGNTLGPNSSIVTGSDGLITYTYSGTGSTTYGPSTTPPSSVGKYKVIATLASNSTHNGASSEEFIFEIIEPLVLLPQASINLKYPSLLASDSVKIKVDIQNGVSPFKINLTNTTDNIQYSFANIKSGQYITLPSRQVNTSYKLNKVIDANGLTRISDFTKDTVNLVILFPKIALTLSADPPIQEPDNSFKLKLIMKIKNEGQLDLNDVQVDANLSNVFPKGMVYVLDSVKVASGNLLINPNYNGLGNSNTSNSSTGFSASSSNIKSNSTLPGNYLFSNGVQLPILYEGQVNFYFSIAETNITTPLILQFNSSGKGVLNQSDYTTSSEATAAFSHDATNPDLHPDIIDIGEPTPTYVSLFPKYLIGAAMKSSNAEVVNGGYVYHFETRVKNYSNMNIDSLSIIHDFTKTFPTPDSAYVVGKPTINDHLIIDTLFNGYDKKSLVTKDGLLSLDDSVVIKYDVFVKTNKIKYTWLNYIDAYAHATIGDSILFDQSTDGAEPDPNGDGKTLEKQFTRCYINFSIPDPPLVINYAYVYNAPNTPESIRPLVKSYPIGTIPTWCNLVTAQCDTVAPKTPKEIGRYIYALKSYDTTSLLYSDRYSYDTITIKPPVPIVSDSTYILGLKVNPKNVTNQFILLSNATPKYYIQSNSNVNVPNLPTSIGVFRYCLSQVVNNIESDTISFNVRMLDVNDVIHLQKIVDSAKLLANSTFNYPFKFIVSNLTPYEFKKVVITDNLQNSAPAISNFIVSQVNKGNSLIANSNFNGSIDINITSPSSSLQGLSKDSVSFIMNLTPNGYSGELSNIAFVNAETIWGNVTMQSSSLSRLEEKSKNATKYNVQDIIVSIPEGFSPNHDGINDTYIIIRPSYVKIELEVFNRWGNIVYQNSNYKNDWDGKGGTSNFAGIDLIDGGYFYVVRAVESSGKITTFQGSVIIQR